MQFKLTEDYGVDFDREHSQVYQLTGFRYWYTPGRAFYICEGHSKHSMGGVWVGDRAWTCADEEGHRKKITEPFEPRFFFAERYMAQFIVRDIRNECKYLPKRPSQEKLQSVIHRIAQAYGGAETRSSIDWRKYIASYEKSWWLPTAFPFTHTMVCVVDDQAMKRRTGKFRSRIRKVRVR